MRKMRIFVDFIRYLLDPRYVWELVRTRIRCIYLIIVRFCHVLSAQ